MDGGSGSSRKLVLAMMMVFLVMTCMVLVVSGRQLNDHEVPSSADSDRIFMPSITSNPETSASVLSTLLPAEAGENGCGGSYCNVISGCDSGCTCLGGLIVGICV
ncbi:hypothetical protein FNV43_RR10516 [Rhamnella rubrinervis]|uniref:Uncharacterized protein n=1 Tax=Rhamnella rubrinervis TaxID=2594499 RepID=A0A8K0MGY5_9ROSA|nr:hypothetical protein FNV43_RR10516 [Rhamnella rubrinervis]